MAQTALPSWNRILPILALAICMTALLCFRASAEIRYDNYIYEDENFLERMDDVRRTASSPFEDVPPDHWSYQAVMRLFQAGLLRGYENDLFRGDQVVTRYELATIVSRLLENYLTWYRSGRMPAREYSSESYEAGSLPSTGPPLSAIAPPEAVISPTRRVSVELPSLGRMGINRTQPRTMGEEQEESDLEKFKLELLEEARKVVNETMDEKIKLTRKDIDDLEKLVNEFQKELKTMNKDLAKKIGENNKLILRNQKDIEKLEAENKRFSITGAERFYWYMEGPVTGDGCYEDSDDGGTYERCNMRTSDLYNTLQLDFTSQPDPNVDLTIGGTMLASVKLGGRRNMLGDSTNAPSDDTVSPASYEYWKAENQAAYKRYTEGQSTALTLRQLYINYSDPDDDAGNPRNFKLRSLQVGNISPMYSFLTVNGKKMEGLAASLKLNDYTFSMFGARERLHQREPFYVPDAEDEDVDWDFNSAFFNEDQYDRYRHGYTVETSLFGNPVSRINFSRMQIYDNKDTNFPGCQTGQWVDLTFAYDQYSFKKPDSDISTTDMFCLPPEKIGVSSIFLIYPLFEGLNLYSEYAHSTYNRDGYKVLKPYNTTANCNTNDPGMEYVCWWQARQENFQDDAFFVLFSYNKGPLTIFPVGYLRLGPEFHTDLDFSAFSGGGGGGFNTSTLSILPISIKSLSAYVGNAGYDINKRSKYETMFLTADEIDPMYFDPGALAWGFRTNSGKETSLPILSTALARLNNRNSSLNLKYWSNKFTHHLTDKISLKMEYSRMSATLPPTCLDGNIVQVYDDFGNVVDKIAGNGVTNCVLESEAGDINFGMKYWNHEQKYRINWDTSKRSLFSTEYKITDSDLTIKFTPAVEDVVLNLAPRGKYFTWTNEFRYSLTDSTRLKFYFSKVYDRYPEGSDTDAEKYPARDSDQFLFSVESSF